MSWSTEERERFSEFVNKVLYETLTDDDYDNTMRKLGANKSNSIGRYNTICHGGNGFNLSYKNKSFYCFSECGCSYSLLSLVKKVKNCSTTKAMKWICEVNDIEYNFKDEDIKQKSNIYNWKKLLKYSKNSNYNELITFDKSVLQFFPREYHEDWIDYGISEDVLHKYGIRWYAYRQQIVIPCLNQKGKLIGIRVRNMNQDVDIKYLPLKLLNGIEFNFPTNEYFYGENFNWVNCQKSKSVILVESEKTVLKYESWYGEDNNICLALYGSILSPQKLKKLLSWGVENFYIALDSDFEKIEFSDNSDYITPYERFEKKVMKIYKMVKPYAKKICVIYNNLGFENCNKFSITDYSKEQFEQLWESKEVIE